MAKKKRSSFLKKTIIWLAIILLIVAGIGGYLAYKTIYQPNVSTGDKKSQIIFIRTGWNFNDVVNMLYEKNIIINRTTFELLAKKKNLPNNIKPGKYRVLKNMSNNELINLLRAGRQELVSITFNNLKTREQLIRRVCIRLEADSTSLEQMMEDDDYLSQSFGLNSENIMALFIPDTYRFYWNTSAVEFLKKMAEIYKEFWTEERKKKANKIGLTQTEIIILASIVQSEQWNFNDEKPIIAGLYLNRLRLGMPLQSDPTLIFALGDYSITRVLNKDKLVNSPYNTYKNKGLPPGPILLPDKSSIDAVLNAKENKYLYMCAKEDFSFRHNFTKTYSEHLVCARKYQKALTEHGINR